MKKKTKIVLILAAVILVFGLTANYITKGIFSNVIDSLNADPDFPVQIVQ